MPRDGHKFSSWSIRSLSTHFNPRAPRGARPQPTLSDYGKRYFADLYRYDQALDQLLETAVVTIDPSADTESDAVTEDAADATEAGSAADASTTYEAAEGTEKTGAAN